MRRFLVLCALALSVAPAHADTSYRIDHLTEADVRFSKGSLTAGDHITAGAYFVRSEPVASSGEEPGSPSVGLCVGVSSHYERREPTDVYTSRWSERGCGTVEPVSESPLRVSATIPTVIRISTGIISGVVEERPSSITVDLVWERYNAVISPTCYAGGYEGMRALPLNVYAEWHLPGSAAVVTGSMVSAVQGDVYAPRGQACFSDGYWTSATIDA